MTISFEYYYAPRIASRKMTKDEWQRYYRAVRLLRRREAELRQAAQACAKAIIQETDELAQTFKQAAETVGKVIDDFARGLSFEELAELAETVDKDGSDVRRYVLRNTVKRSQSEFYAGFRQGQRDWLYGDPFCKTAATNAKQIRTQKGAILI